MAYFEPSIDADGIHIPTYDEIMEYLITRYKGIFGDDVYIGEETKDYQLLSVFAKCMDDYAALVIDSYNSRNPNYATGDSLDMLLPLVSMSRRAATYSKVTLKLTGDEGYEVEAGSSAIDTNGVLWAIDEDVLFDSTGIAYVGATCETDGAIPAPIGTINQIYTPVIGWNEVTNEAEAIIGLNQETDDELRTRRKNSVNLHNNGLYDALMRALLNLVIDGSYLTFASVLQNDTNSTDANGIPAHSVCCVVDGLDGHEYEIAEAIWKAKAPGVGTYGGPAGDNCKAINYVDDYGNTNVVRFARPTKSAVTVVVTIHTLSGYDADRCVPIIKSAIMDSINNLGIGKPWNVTMAYKDVYNAFSGEVCPFVISQVTGVKSGMGSASTIEVPCTFNEVLEVEDTDITVTVAVG